MPGNYLSGHVPLSHTAIQRLVANNQWVPDSIDLDTLEPRQPIDATDAQPGSPDKIRILAERSARGEPLFGALDVTTFAEGSERCTRRADENLPRRFA